MSLPDTSEPDRSEPVRSEPVSSRPFAEPEPVRTAADLLNLGYWRFHRRTGRFVISLRALEILGGTGSLEERLPEGEYQSLIEQAGRSAQIEVALTTIEGRRVHFRGWLEYPSSPEMVGVLSGVHFEGSPFAPNPGPTPQGKGLTSEAGPPPEPVHSLLSLAVEQALEALLVLKAVRTAGGETVDFEVVEANSKGAELLGRRAEEARGRLLSQIVPSLEEDGTLERYARAMNDGKPVEAEFYASPGGVQRIWVHQLFVQDPAATEIYTRDVSRSRLADETAERSRRMFERIAVTTPDALLLWDVDTFRLVYANTQVSKLFGWTTGEARRESIGDLETVVAAGDLDRLRAHLTALASSDTDSAHEATLIVSNAPEPKTLLFRSQVFARKPSLRPKTILTSVQDVTEPSNARRELERKMAELSAAQADLEKQREELLRLNVKLSDMALTDASTGIRNRRAFQEKLEEETERAQRYNTRLAIVLADIDRFKAYNDTYGHPEGDEALKKFAEVLTQVCRKSDTVARYGGEEFAIILPNTGATEAGLLGERIRQALAESRLAERGVTASIGCAEFMPGKDGQARLVSEADRALYESKNRGRDRVTIFGRPETPH